MNGRSQREDEEAYLNAMASFPPEVIAAGRQGPIGVPEFPPEDSGVMSDVPTPEEVAAVVSPEKPVEETWEVFVNLRESRRIDGRVCVAGKGKFPSELMFIMSSVLEEECEEEEIGTYGNKFKRRPSMLKGPTGMAVRELCTSVGIDIDGQAYVTALCKWLLPKGERLAPKRKQCEPGYRCLAREVKEVTPKIVVTFGKAAFEFMVPTRMRFDDVVGCWFWSEEYQCRVMPMKHSFYILAKPDWMETFRMDMQQVTEMIGEINGIVVQKVPLFYSVISNASELREIVKELMLFNLYSIDCEWHGRNHVDGKLRSLQICWKEGHVIYIRFMDDALNYVFDVSYAEAGAILAPAWNRPELKLIGHHISADLPWTFFWLGLHWYNKVLMDTEFAYQCCNEHAQLGLERHSVRFTDLGRYELELEMAKKDKGLDVKDGYGFVPDPILIPYAQRDVDVPFRSYPQIRAEMERQKLTDYYDKILNPFVTNLFTQFALTGLPMNMERLEEMRSLYAFAYDRMELNLRRALYKEAWDLVAQRFVKAGLDPTVASDAAAYLRSMHENCQVAKTDSWEGMVETMKNLVAIKDRAAVLPALEHAYNVQNFNIRSTPAMKRWLFDVKGYTPIKSTANKARGVPAMDWSKIMGWKPERRVGIVPAVDKQTLQILADQHKDDALKQLLRLNAVGNIRKAFLKDPIRNQETGEVIEEAGLFAWVASDTRVHGQYSLTETGRPRAWKPNVLNWPSFVQDRIKEGIAAALKEAHEEGALPAEFLVYVTGGKKVPPLRSCVWAPPGMCMVESDFKTAEIRGLAFISGDTNLIRIMTEPDQQFALIKHEKETAEIRLFYASDCAIAPANQDPSCIMHLWDKGALVRAVSQEELLRNADGSLRHPDADLHWSLAERVHSKPREKMNKKVDRGAAKVGNFSSAYGATPATLERKIEADTGKKPEEGTGEKILEALANRQPQSDAFLKAVESAPLSPGYLRAASGRVRHFVMPSDVAGLSGNLKNSILSSQGREGRNFPMQESVASSASIAGNNLLDFKYTCGLQGVPMIILYDSVVTLCPPSERRIWQKAHELFMYLANGWRYHGRVLRYPIDTELNTGWSERPSGTASALLESEHYQPTPPHFKKVEEWLDQSIAHYIKYPDASVYNR